jgi:adenylate cyclase class 2
MIEVELKFEIPTASRALLQEKIGTVPSVRQLGQIDNSDIYYDTANFDCLQQAVFIRIRNRARLELKFHDYADPAHTHSTERSFPLQLEPPQMKEMNMLCSRFIPGWREVEVDSVEEAICLNDMLEFAHITNRRTQFAHENLVLCLDDVEGLGNFLEVEAVCNEESEIDRTLTRLHDFVSGLAFPNLQPVQTGYVEQWLRLHRSPVYQLRKGTT